MSWTVHKFGGSSLADATCYRRVADIVVSQPEGNLAVVVSAIGGVTDLLLGLIDKASSDKPVDTTVATLRSRHEGIVSELLTPQRAEKLLSEFGADLEDIGSVLKALSVVKSASHRSRDLVAGYGEIWSARLLAGPVGLGSVPRLQHQRSCCRHHQRPGRPVRRRLEWSRRTGQRPLL